MNEHHLAYLLQRAAVGVAPAWHFAWVDKNWPTCAELDYHSSSRIDVPLEMLSWAAYSRQAAIAKARPDTVSATDWTRFLARLSYCAEIGLTTDEAVDAVLHAEVGVLEGPIADALQADLERATGALALVGMLGCGLALVDVKASLEARE